MGSSTNTLDNIAGKEDLQIFKSLMTPTLEIIQQPVLFFSNISLCYVLRDMHALRAWACSCSWSSSIKEVTFAFFFPLQEAHTI